MDENIEENQFSLAEDALLMSIVKRWTNVVYEDNSDVVTKAEKTKAWKKIEQTFNNLSVDYNKGFRTAETLKIRSDLLERLKNRRELMQSLASGEGDAATGRVDDAVMKNPIPIDNSKSKHQRKDDGDGNKSTDDATLQTDSSAEDEIRLDLLQLFRLREKLLRKEIKIRIEHSRQIFEKEMEILEIKRKNLLPMQRSEPRSKPKRKTINRGEEYRQRPCWGQSIASVREDVNKKVQPIRSKRRVKKASKIDNDRGNGKRKRASAWSRLDDGTTDNEDLASLTDDDGRVKLMLEHLKTRKETEAGRADNAADDTETEGTDSRWDNMDKSERTIQELRVGAIQTVQDIGYASDASLPKKLANILDKILKHDSIEEFGKRNRIEK
uniref:Regulatory protein zeste n=1 Tax=Lygus hesperus TaxID=30085 RepID=A0A0A9ZC49_LYGHE